MYKFICPCCGKQYEFDIIDGSVVLAEPSSLSVDNAYLVDTRYDFGVPREEVSDVSG